MATRSIQAAAERTRQDDSTMEESELEDLRPYSVSPVTQLGGFEHKGLSNQIAGYLILKQAISHLTMDHESVKSPLFPNPNTSEASP